MERHLIHRAVDHWQATQYRIHYRSWIAFDMNCDIASLVSDLRLCVLNAAPFENRWWRLTANLTEHAAQLLVQALVVSRLDYCNALLARLPSNTIKTLQMIQNAAARLVFNKPKRTHVTPLFISLHWLPVAARIKFKTLMLAYRTTTGSAPSYFHYSEIC